MSDPIRCISSRLTTQLMLFRNPQGSEQNWVNERIDNRVIYYGKVITTEIGACLLCVTASVECVAYGILAIVSIAALPCTKKPLDFFMDRVSSSGFTIYWNLGTVLVFNAFYINLNTHESFARHSLDTSERGNLFRLAFKTCKVVILCVLILNRIPVSLTSFDEIINSRYTRWQDVLYIARWSAQFPGAIRALGHTTRAYSIANFGVQTNRNIEEGTKIFREYILAEGQIHADSRDLVLECDPEVYHFVLTRVVYLYAFGILRSQPVPNFLTPQTNLKITALRNDYQEGRGISLQQLIFDHTLPIETLSQDDKLLFNELRNIASGELRGIFVKKCWQDACAPQVS